MNIQIIGHSKCNNTKKAIRFFKERNIKFHFKNITEKPVEMWELKNIRRVIHIDDLINKESKVYKSKGYEYMDFDAAEEILENPMLLKTPIVRNGNKACLGYNPEVWKEWLKEAQT